MCVPSPDYCEGTVGVTMDVGVRNRKNKDSPKTGKKNGKASDGTQDHEALKKTIEKLQLNEKNINRDSVSTASVCYGYMYVCMCVCVCMSSSL